MSLPKNISVVRSQVFHDCVWFSNVQLAIFQGMSSLSHQVLQSSRVSPRLGGLLQPGLGERLAGFARTMTLKLLRYRQAALQFWILMPLVVRLDETRHAVCVPGWASQASPVSQVNPAGWIASGASWFSSFCYLVKLIGQWRKVSIWTDWSRVPRIAASGLPSFCLQRRHDIRRLQLFQRNSSLDSVETYWTSLQAPMMPMACTGPVLPIGGGLIET